tara:strand:- start:1295 stop:2155 length:861 start_codon:yes stop_codon:yes gene_type:complete
MRIGNVDINNDSKAYVIAEIGLNHNGDMELAKKLIIEAKRCGADAVKFQKRFPDECVPDNKKKEMRMTPWGEMTYLDYRFKVEFDENDYDEIAVFCKNEGIDWFVSVWDHSSIDFMKKYDPIAVKVPSDKMNDLPFLEKMKELKCPIIMSSGGTEYGVLDDAVKCLGSENNALLQCTSVYPCQTEQMNLEVIKDFINRYQIISGLSSHHTSPVFGSFSLSYGARIVEQHFTLNRAFWGSDQSMSLEPRGLELLVKYIRMFEESKGDGIKKVYDQEKKVLSRTTGRS